MYSQFLNCDAKCHETVHMTTEHVEHVCSMCSEGVSCLEKKAKLKEGKYDAFVSRCLLLMLLILYGCIIYV